MKEFIRDGKRQDAKLFRYSCSEWCQAPAKSSNVNRDVRHVIEGMKSRVTRVHLSRCKYVDTSCPACEKVAVHVIPKRLLKYALVGLHAYVY